MSPTEVSMPWHGGKTVVFVLDDDVPDAQAVLDQAAKVVIVVTDANMIAAVLASSFSERLLDVDVVQGHRHGDEFGNRITVEIRRNVLGRAGG